MSIYVVVVMEKVGRGVRGGSRDTNRDGGKETRDRWLSAPDG